MNFHDFIRDSEGWQTLTRELQFDNPYLQVYRTETRTPSRPDETRSWSVVHRKGAAVVAPQTEDGKFLLVRQERIPIRATIWEFPAGQIDESKGHSEQLIRETALRELREESGHELAPDGQLIPLGHFFPSCGFTDEHSYLFLARSVIPYSAGHQLDANEVITECRAFSAEEFRAMIASGEIRDANTLSAFARMCALGLI
jgi:8-oxo-dGTP pyrophosphatase MutT (NUDIX family)